MNNWRAGTALLIFVWIIALFGIISLADEITQWGMDKQTIEAVGMVAHKVNVACGL